MVKVLSNSIEKKSASLLAGVPPPMRSSWHLSLSLATSESGEKFAAEPESVVLFNTGSGLKHLECFRES